MKKKKRAGIKVDIDLISEECYNFLLKEFRYQFGEGYYTDWEITAVREEE